MNNYEKFSDIMRNKDMLGKIMMNFPKNEELNKLANEFSIPTFNIKIF